MPNIQSLSFFLPELILSGGALLLILYSVIPVRLRRRNPANSSARDVRFRGHDISFFFAIITLLLSLFLTLTQWEIGNPPLFHGLLILDRPAMFFKVIFIVTTVIIMIFSFSPSSMAGEGRGEGGRDTPEYLALLLGAVVGMNMLASANNLLAIYLSLEFVSLMSYMLVGWTRGSARSSEAALKYILYGAVASGIFLFGASLYYGLTGTLDITSLMSGVADFSPRQFILSQTKVCYSISGLLLLAGFLFKIAAVPMQAWCPDAYQGAPTPITAFLSVAPKAAGFAVLMRVASEIGATFNWPVVIAVVSAVTMTFGNLAAIPQNNLKRLLAYSSIAHAGYLLMGVACMTQKGYQAVYFYFIAYLVMNLGAFVVVQIVEGGACHSREACPRPRSGGGNPVNAGDPRRSLPSNDSIGGGDDILSYTGLGRRGAGGALLGIAMTIFLLSLTGVPPFVGFIGKFYIFSAVIDSKLYWLAVIGIINSVVSLYYYMRIVKAMFFESAADTVPLSIEPAPLTVTLVALAFLTVILGLAWQPLAELVVGI